MSSELLKAVNEQIDLVLNDGVPSSLVDGKTISMRVTREMYDEIDTLSGALMLSKSDFLRMIVESAIKDIKRETKFQSEGFGMTPSQIDDFVHLSAEEQQRFLQGLGLTKEGK